MIRYRTHGNYVHNAMTPLNITPVLVRCGLLALPRMQGSRARRFAYCSGTWELVRSARPAYTVGSLVTPVEPNRRRNPLNGASMK
jgi:hypothetical protein